MVVSPTLLDVLERSRSLGLLGPGDVGTHILHATGFVTLIGEATSLLDLGSGGGLPGLVIAEAHPKLEVVLLDAGGRRVAFLRDAIRRLEMAPRVQAVEGRAESIARSTDFRDRFDVVTARSFGPPAVTAECGAAFLRATGRLLVSEPEDVEDRWPADGLAQVGLRPGEVHRSNESTIRELWRNGEDIAEVPRRDGVPTRRPLF